MPPTTPRTVATVLITGASGGIGQALADCYAAPGCTLVLHGRDPQRLQVLAQRCRERGARTDVLEHDLADSAGWMARLSTYCADTPIDLALLCAGVAGTPADGLDPWDGVQAMLDVNLRAAMATVSVLAAPMGRRGHGQIALIGSLAAHVGMPLSPAYCASKAGLKAYGEAMRSVLAPHGVALTVVLPGFVETAMSDRYPAPKPFMVSAPQAARRIQSALRRNPARIAFPQPLAFGMWALGSLPPAWAQWLLRRLGYGVDKPGGRRA